MRLRAGLLAEFPELPDDATTTTPWSSAYCSADRTTGLGCAIAQ